MLISHRRSLTILASLLFSASSALAQATADPSGHWEGQIRIPEHVLTMNVDIAKSPSGTWIGSMNILHSTTVDVPLDTVTIADGTVRFTASLPGKTLFDGRLSADAQGLSGTASNESGGVPFQLTRTRDADVKIPPPSSRLVPAGTWEGTLDVDGQTRRVRVKIAASADGTATAVLISVDKGNLEIPVTTVTLHDQELQLDARAISGRYRGTLGADGTIVGEWMEGDLRFPLALKHVS